MNFYNEIDPFAAAWLRELIKGGHIAPGIVDERSIEDLQTDELRQYTQCHFFAGIGVWSYALRAAGWADDIPIWTGSCPCQSFSSSGKWRGFSDKRHLWPAWFRLIRECRPDICIGEQVASKDGLAWFDVVSAELEGEGYAVGAADLCAAGVGAPHIRQRLYFVAHADRSGTRSLAGNHRQVGGEALRDLRADDGSPLFMRDGKPGSVAHAEDSRRNDTRKHGSGLPLLPARSEQCGDAGSVAHIAAGDGETECRDDAERTRLEGHIGDERIRNQLGWLDAEQARSAFEAGATRAHARKTECGSDARYGFEHKRARSSREQHQAGPSERGGLAGDGKTECGSHALHSERRTLNIDGQDGRNRQDGGRAEARGEPGAYGEVRGTGARREAQGRDADGRDSEASDMSDSESERCEEGPPVGGRTQRTSEHGATRGHGNADSAGRKALRGESVRGEARPERIAESGGVIDDDYRTVRRLASEQGATRGFWADCDWWYGRDGKYRPTQSGLLPLAHGTPNRVGRLRGYGNAIVAPVAEAFIRSVMEALD